MYTTLEVTLIATAALLLGALIGYLVSRHFSAGGRHDDRKLQQVEDEHRHYRYEVTDHFNKTADMLAQLATSYREMHNHLAQGAQSLCDPAAVRALQALPDDEATRSVPRTASGSAIEAPRDYAVGGDHGEGHEERDDRDSRATVAEPPRW